MLFQNFITRNVLGRLFNGSLCELTGNGSNGWIIPLSWKSVYGPPPDMSIF
uniref:Uncharacterized protein n=1 Tax=Arundo donax TaxID=35708 RepID=A0A0A9DW53_ARUDO